MALQTFLGGVNVNDFSRFGRSFKVSMQAEPEYRADIKGLNLLHVRAASGEMVPLSTLITPASIAAPTTLQRYNLYRTADIGGDAAPGFSSGQAITAMEEVAREVLPQGYGYEWAGISKQEKESAGQAPVIFAFAILFVFLFLAALYESWAVPFAVLFAVPLGIFGAMVGLYLTGLTNNIYAQIGLVLLIGLAAKNAILIVEFAKMKRDAGMDAVSAAIEAARLRLRPIVMTSLAFIPHRVEGLLGLAPGAPGLVHRARIHARLLVEQRAHGCRAREALPGVLAMDLHQVFGRLAQLRHGGTAAVDPGSAAALLIHSAPQQEQAFGCFEAGLVQPVGQRCGAVELRAHLRTGRTFAHAQRIGPGPEHELQRVHEDRLACARLAREHREAAPEVEFEPVHEHEITQREPAQHQATPSYQRSLRRSVA